MGIADRESAPGSITQRTDTAEEARKTIEELLGSLELASDAAERARIFVHIALAFRDGLRDRRQALDALIEAWQLDPTHPEVLDHLEPLARAENRWPEVFDVTRKALAVEHLKERAFAYLEAMVGWLTREVPDHDQAVQYLDRIRDVDATHWLVHLFQAAKYEEHGDRRRELEALDRAVLSAKRAADRARIHVMMAKRYAVEPMLNPAEAKRHLRKAHELVPTSPTALRALEEIFVAEGDVASLAEVLELQVDITREDERADILLRLADIYEKDFLKPDLAATKLEQAFALDPNRDEALAGLQRCYTATRSWHDLVRVVEGAVVLVDDPELRAERLILLAEIYESRLSDYRGARRAFEQLAGIMGEDETLIGELARLSEKIGDWEAAARHRVKLAGLAEDPATSARMRVLAGQLTAPHDPVAARAHFEAAVLIEPTNAAAYTALLADARAAEDWPRLVGYLEARVAATAAPRQQAQIYGDLGDVKHAQGDVAGAIAAWESARAADPHHEGAARALLDAYVAGKQWSEAAPLCDIVLRAAERETDWRKLYAARCQAFVVANALGRRERALDMIVGAFTLYAEDNSVREWLVASAWALREDPQVLQAVDVLTEIADARAGLSRPRLVELAEILALVGDTQRAMSIFDEVLAMDATDARALEGLAGLRAARGESLQAWTLKRQLAVTTADENARLALLLETADGLANDANRPDLAADVYEQARALRPRDHVLLHKLLAQYQALERWPQVFDVLRAIVDSDDDASRRAKVVMTMAVIAQRKLRDPMTAVGLYDEVLDLDPSRLDAFEHIVKLLTEARDPHGLAAMYKRMIVRAVTAGDTRLEQLLQVQLGLIYRDRLQDRDRAITAFRDAVTLRPDDEQTQTMLRELLALSGRPDDAVAHTMVRVREEPLEPAPYAALFDLLMQLGRFDKAWCVASMMAHLGVAHAPAAQYFAERPAPTLQQIGGTLGAYGWQRLLHPELDPSLTNIFEIMGQAAVAARIAALGFRERLAHPGPVLKDPEFLLEDVTRASQVLGITPPRLHRGRMPPTLVVAATQPPSLLVHYESLAGYPRNLLAFWIGKRLAELTPPLLARGLFRSVTELKELVTAAARIVAGTVEPADAALKRHLGRGQVEALGVAIETARQRPAPLDVRRWSQLADLSSSRAGLLLAGDIGAARQALMHEQQAPGDLGPREQTRELALFFLGDEYAQIRKELGVAIAWQT